MKERSIQFNDEEIRAILAGKKTQTRRPVKTKNGPKCDGVRPCSCPFPKSFGNIGDTFWIKEAFVVGCFNDGNGVMMFVDGGKILPQTTWYRADRDLDTWYRDDNEVAIPWRSAYHMPKWASRIKLKIKRVWIERDDEDKWFWRCEFEVTK